MSKLKNINMSNKDDLDKSKDDFESPIVFKKFKSSNENGVPKRTKTKKSCKKKQLTLHQVYQDNLKYSDMNSEHLQLALALSRSTTEMYNNCSMNEEFPLVSQTSGKKKTLLEFGFRTDKPRMNVENKILRKEPTKTNKKSKYRFITPVLMMRTQEERESLIQSKLLSLFSQSSGFPSDFSNSIPEVSSEELKKLRCRECSKFFFSKFESPKEEDFTVPHLNIEGTRAKCGSLLKDWKKIPLRDHTPERSKNEISHTIEDPSISKNISEVTEQLPKPEKDSVGVETSIIIPSVDSEGEVVQMNQAISQSIESYDNQLSVDVRFGAVSPDLFDDTFSLSEDHHNIEVETKKNLKNESFNEEIMLEDNLESSTAPSDKQNHFTAKVFQLNSEKALEQEKNFFSKVNVEFSEYECGEKKQNEVETFKTPPIGDHNNVISGNETQIIVPNSKDKSEEFSNGKNFLHDLQADTVILSSDEELSTLENEISRSFPERKNFLDNESFGNMDEDSCMHKIDISKSKKKYSLDFEETSLNNDDIENMSKKEDYEVVLSSDEEISERISDSLKLKELSKKYITQSNVSPVQEKSKIINHSYSEEHTFPEIMFLDSFKFLKTKKVDEEIKADISSNLSLKCDKFDTVVSSDDDIPDFKINKKFSDSFDELHSFEFSNGKKSVSPQKQCDSDIEKSKQTFPDFSSDSLLDNVFEKNFPDTINNSNESKKSGTSAGSLRMSKKCWNESYEVCNEAKLTDVSSSSSSIDCIENLKDVEIVEDLPFDDIFESEEIISNFNSTNTPNQKSKKSCSTPLRRYTSFVDNVTPKGINNIIRHKSEPNITPNEKFIVKTVDVTPMADYKAFSTPEIVQELGKFGLKPLKRKRGINLLEHIYETIHPKVEVHRTDIENLPNTKRKKSQESHKKCPSLANSHRMDTESELLKKWTGTISDSEAIFERKRSTKIPTCQIPLQIVWHNFLNENPEIFKNILLYEPLQVEVIHKMLKELGYKFHLQDLITFLDQKCITIRVAQNQHSKVG